MSLSAYFYKNIHEQLKIIDILPQKPKHKVRLDPIDPQDLNVDFQTVQKWSRNNSQLLHLIMQNGMATFICNYQFINQHYQQLIFVDRAIKQIDLGSLKLKNLLTLNLSENNIRILQNIPPNLQQLYLDFNQIDQIKSLKKSSHQNLVLLSISHNLLEDSHIQKISHNYPSLRCLNLAYNSISDIRKFVQVYKNRQKLKILSLFGNPISLLKIYYQFITDRLDLKVFDNKKYVRPAQPKKTQTKKPQQPKQQVKQQKKDAKKDTKKPANSKQPQPVIQQVKAVQSIPIKKQLTQRDFIKCAVKLHINNFQNFNGNIFDSSIFGTQISIDKTQTNYWISYQFMGVKQNLYQKRVRFDEATVVQNEPSRLTFNLQLTNEFRIGQGNKERFQKGILIKVHSQQPKVQTNPENGQQKVIKQNNQVVMKRQIIGAVFVDTRNILKNKTKNLQQLFRLWDPAVCQRPYFRDKLPNQEHQINKRKQQFEQKLKKQQQQKNKLLQQQQAAKNQKKGGKDAKKAQKKPQKKQGKQAVQQKKNVQRCNYPLDQKIYCYLNANRLQKCRKQSLAIKIQIL